VAQNGVGYSAICYIPAGVTVTNQQLYERMSGYFLSTLVNGSDKLAIIEGRVVLLRGRWALQVGFRNDILRLATAREIALPHVQDEAQAELIETCAGIFYLQTALDPDGQYFNDYVGALECVQQIVPGVLLFDMAANDFV
jgi:hypothetical protein